MDRKSFSLNVEGIDIIGETYFPRGQGRKPALCICHGVPGPTRDANDPGYPALAELFSERGFVVTIFNFRGTGESGGNFEILGWTRDLRAVLDYHWGLGEVDRSRISLLGFSGGAAVSIYTAAHDQRVSSVVACACPADFAAIVGPERVESYIAEARQIGIIRDEGFPPSLEEWALGFVQVAPQKWVDKVSPRPLFLIHGDRDDLVPVTHARELYERAHSPKELLIIEGGEHQLRRNEKAIGAVLSWLEKVNGVKGEA